MSSRTVPIDLLVATLGFADGRGWDVEDVLRQAGISTAVLAEGRSRVTEKQLAAVVQEMWRRTDDELFGLGAYPLPRGSLRLLFYGLIGAKDLATALDRVQILVRAMPAIPRVELQRDDDIVRLSFAAPLSSDPDLGFNAPLPVCVGLAVLHRLMAWAIGGRLELVAVELSYPAQLDEWHDFIFAAPRVYDAPRPGIVFKSSLLGRPIMRTEAELDAFLASSPEGLFSRPPHTVTLTGQIRRMVEQAVEDSHPTEIPAGKVVAERLAISEQTLRRRLAAQGTSLRQVREEVLRDQAIRALVETDESIADLSARLGFSEPSAFTRAFRRWTGNAPSAYRALER